MSCACSTERSPIIGASEIFCRSCSRLGAGLRLRRPRSRVRSTGISFADAAAIIWSLLTSIESPRRRRRSADETDVPRPLTEHAIEYKATRWGHGLRGRPLARLTARAANWMLSTLAVPLVEISRLSVMELDKIVWGPSLVATPRDRWVEIQQELLSAEERWILDGDLGPYDALEVRLQAADTIVSLDFSPVRCAWRALRRSRERFDFWLRLLQYRRHSRRFS